MRNIARFFFIFLFMPISMALADTQKIQPNTELTPAEVVQIVIEALKTNDSSKNDAGIATVFEFASPGNKTVTGPLERFTTMIKGGFSNMLNHVDSDFDEMEIDGNTALQVVWLTTLTGAEVGYVFQLGKQSGGKHNDMWMTESVWPIAARKPPGQSI